MIVNAEIKEALRQLGYEVGFEMDAPEAVITPISKDRDRYRVDLDGQYIGIWDRIKKTFID